MPPNKAPGEKTKVLLEQIHQKRKTGNSNDTQKHEKSVASKGKGKRKRSRHKKIPPRKNSTERILTRQKHHESLQIPTIHDEIKILHQDRETKEAKKTKIERRGEESKVGEKRIAENGCLNTEQ